MFSDHLHCVLIYTAILMCQRTVFHVKLSSLVIANAFNAVGVGIHVDNH